MTLPAAPRAKDAETEGARVAGVYRGLRVATYRSEAAVKSLLLRIYGASAAERQYRGRGRPSL